MAQKVETVGQTSDQIKICEVRTIDLHSAAIRGDLDAIKAAAEQGCDVNAPGSNGKTPLWFAVHYGKTDACRLLIARGAKIEAQTSRILEAAVERGHAEIVALLWPHCTAEMEHRSLESSISLGFHEIADFLIESGDFEYKRSETSKHTEYCYLRGGFPERSSVAFQQWERFFFVRRGQKLPLHRVFFDYALLLAAKADQDTGARLMNFLLTETIAYVNCMVKINDDFETPLTAAAEKGNPGILETLIGLPNICLTLCGKFNWPAFLHFLASPQSITTERGREISRNLFFESPFKRLFTGLVTGSGETCLKTVFKNVLQFGDTVLVRQLIGLVRGAAGILILPLLMRAKEVDGLTWILNSDAVSSSNPPPDLWVLLCQYFQRNEDQEALGVFVSVADFLVQKKIWNRVILNCLNARNFSFVKQFFYPLYRAPPKEVTEESLAGLPAVSTDKILMKEWADQGYARAALWDAIHYGIWKKPAFDMILLTPGVDLNGPDPHLTSPGRQELGRIPHEFFNDQPYEGETPQRISFRSHPGASAGPYPPNPAVLRSYQEQLILLEQENKRRLVVKRDGNIKSPLAWAVATRNAQLVDTLLLSPQVNVNSQDPCNRTPLMHAIGVASRPIVEKLLQHRDIELNLRDAAGRTAIFYAAQVGNLDIVQLLMGTKKVDVSIRDINGQLARDWAEKRGFKDVVAALTSTN